MTYSRTVSAKVIKSAVRRVRRVSSAKCDGTRRRTELRTHVSIRLELGSAAVKWLKQSIFTNRHLHRKKCTALNKRRVGIWLRYLTTIVGVFCWASCVQPTHLHNYAQSHRNV